MDVHVGGLIKQIQTFTKETGVRVLCEPKSQHLPFSTYVTYVKLSFPEPKQTVCWINPTKLRLLHVFLLLGWQGSTGYGSPPHRG